MTDFKDLVAKLNAISNNEQIVNGNGDEVYKPVEEAVAGTKQTASILKAFNEIEGERVAEAKAKAEAENGRIAIRNVRRDALTAMKNLEKEGELTKDDISDSEKDIQDITTNFIDQVDSSLATKEKDLLTI